jgi:hypothetical protein
VEPGLLLWVFILVGNAVALVALSAITAGGTSAMSGGDVVTHPRDIEARSIGARGSRAAELKRRADSR